MNEETPYLTITSKEYYDLLKVAQHAKAITLIRDQRDEGLAEFEDRIDVELEAICDELETDLQELEKGIAPSAYLNAK
tara:strand:+ start:462 stop:695 length:234 start_codon:yes stop_codon:yes gene_type:complete